MIVKEKLRARVVYDTKRQMFAVHLGVTVPHYGTLFSCEQWCEDRAIPITNRGELNRIKYSNMPKEKMFNLQ